MFIYYYYSFFLNLTQVPSVWPVFLCCLGAHTCRGPAYFFVTLGWFPQSSGCYFVLCDHVLIWLYVWLSSAGAQDVKRWLPTSKCST